jgi:hypothetical protein
MRVTPQMRVFQQPLQGSSEMLKNYKELKVWQKSYELCLEIYRITAKFPKEERKLESLPPWPRPTNLTRLSIICHNYEA